MPMREELVEGPDDTTYTVRVEPARRWDLNPFGRRRVLPWLRADRSWWVTVMSTRVPWAVLKERHPTEPAAHHRAAEVAASLRAGTLSLPPWPPALWRSPEGS